MVTSWMGAARRYNFLGYFPPPASDFKWFRARPCIVNETASLELLTSVLERGES